MRFLVHLFYILLIIFLIGIVLLFLVCENSILSRIATGLVTGSFVAGINAFVNYKHQRKSFFESLSSFLYKVESALFNDYSEINSFILFMPSKEDLKKNIRAIYRLQGHEYSKKYNQYQDLCHESINREFAELIRTDFFDKLADWFNDLDEELTKDLLHIQDLNMVHSFSTLPGEEPKLKGNVSDEFIAEYITRCNNYKARIAYSIVAFANTCFPFFELLKKEVSDADYDGVTSAFQLMKSLVKTEGVFIDPHGIIMTFDEVNNEWN